MSIELKIIIVFAQHFLLPHLIACFVRNELEIVAIFMATMQWKRFTNRKQFQERRILCTSIRIRIRLPFPINFLTFRPVPAELCSNLLSKSQTSLEEFAVSLSRKSNKKNHFSSKEEGVRGGQRPLQWRFAFDFSGRLICQTQFSFLFNMQEIRVNLLTF